VGIVFRKTDPAIANKTADRAAQMFLDDGDGVVIRGEIEPWYSVEKKQFHLTRKAAKELLTKVLHTYSDRESKPFEKYFFIIDRS
jgi:phenylalanyl-tRNA synthetase beta subunit